MPPLLLPLLEALAPLLKKRDTWYILAIAMLCCLLGLERRRAAADEAALAQRPAVSDSAKVSTDLHEEKGKVTIVERFLPAPPATAACPDPKPQLAERQITREPSVIDRKTDTQTAHAEIPACPAAPPEPWREVDAILDPFAPSKLVGLGGSVTLKRHFVLGAGGRVDRGGEGHAFVGVRF
jgi:hypothetical protein